MTSDSGASSERDRDRRSSLHSFGQGSGVGGGVGGAGGSGSREGEYEYLPMPVPMPPRKRYSSSFGHRYVGSVGGGTGIPAPGSRSGSANRGGRGMGGLKVEALAAAVRAHLGAGIGAVEALLPALVLVVGKRGGKRLAGSFYLIGRELCVLGSVASFLGARTDDDDISIFVQDIEERKPLTGRAKEREKRDRDREQLEQQERHGWQYDQRGLGRDLEPSESSAKGKEKERPGTKQQEAETDMDNRQRRLHDDAGGYMASLPPLHDLPNFDATNHHLMSAAERAAQLSTSPNRGPMLTSQNEVDERLKEMNERFLKSLEGISGGARGRRTGRRIAAQVPLLLLRLSRITETELRRVETAAHAHYAGSALGSLLENAANTTWI
ncbi:hypothetical protein CVT25_014725 [Psilocybe cyanescens]|uniref:Uncharacterized protein n=1 Tax=Psilocybe cyanescens TaxID=93625 RepID=A0A409XK09_PSICY|nr:hypothetical protein CVT25_014725 [Psilocybe cyanescens]